MEYESQSDLRNRIERLDSYYLEHLKCRFRANEQSLKENVKRKYSLLLYLDSLVVIKYLMNKNDVEGLKDLGFGSICQSVGKQNLMNPEIRKYIYANQLLEYYVYVTNLKNTFNSIGMKIDLSYLGGATTGNSELKIDIYSRSNNQTNIVYESNSVRLELESGVAISEFPLKNVVVKILDESSTEIRKYEYDDFKIY